MNGIRKHLLITTLAVAGIAMAALPAVGGVKYENGDKWVELGGRLQLQYHYTDPDGDADSEDELFFRRLRPYIEGSIHPDWYGKFQFDLGKAEGDNELAIKDAYMDYTGIDNVSIKLGNAYTQFSRETLTSSKRQQLVERTFAGDHNYGAPDRNLGLHVAGKLMDKRLVISTDLVQADIDPDVKKLDFDTPVNANIDFNQGYLVNGRIDFHPFGYLKMAQGDFKKDLKATISVAAFNWFNDDDNNTHTDSAGLSTDSGKADVDSATGFEVSGAVRFQGISIDAEYNLFNAETLDNAFTGGIYKNGETDLENWSVKGGYMLPNNMFEVVAAYQMQDADGYADEWTRTSFGANYFVTKSHDIKLQATYRIGKSLDGVKDKDEDEIFVQAQYVF